MKEEPKIDTTIIDTTLDAVTQILVMQSPDEIAKNRDFADALEIWLAALLVVHPLWTRHGRWFDGLLVDTCVKSASVVSVSGRVVIVSSQRELRFSTTISTLPAERGNFEFQALEPELDRPLSASRGRSRYPFPLHRWGRVDGHDRVSAVRIDEATGGFIFITEEPHGTVDVWLEEETDVIEALSEMLIVWDPATLELH